MNTAEEKEMTFREFIEWADVLQYSEEYFEVMRECHELDLLNLVIESSEFYMENFDYLSEAQEDYLLSNYMTEGFKEEQLKNISQGGTAPAQEETMKKKAARLAGQAKRDVKAAPGNAKQALADAKDKMAAGASKVRNYLKDTDAKQIAKDAGNKAKSIWQRILGWLKAAWTAIKGFFSRIGDVFTNRQAKMEKEIQTLRGLLQQSEQDLAAGAQRIAASMKAMKATITGLKGKIEEHRQAEQSARTAYHIEIANNRVLTAKGNEYAKSMEALAAKFDRVNKDYGDILRDVALYSQNVIEIHSPVFIGSVESFAQTFSNILKEIRKGNSDSVKVSGLMQTLRSKMDNAIQIKKQKLILDQDVAASIDALKKADADFQSSMQGIQDAIQGVTHNDRPGVQKTMSSIATDFANLAQKYSTFTAQGIIAFNKFKTGRENLLNQASAMAANLAA